MASTKESYRNLQLSDAQKAHLTPERIARIEAALEELKTSSLPLRNPSGFDAKGIVPVDFPEGQLIPWNVVDEENADADGGRGDGDGPK